MPRTVSRKNILYPRGYIYVAPLDDNGVKQGLIDIGESMDFTVTLAIDEEEIISGRGGIKELFDTMKIAGGVEIAFEAKEFNRENINLAFLGDGLNALLQGSGVVSDLPITVKALDRWYQLGYRDCVSIDVDGYVLDVDYKVRSLSGRETLIMPLSEGSIAVDEVLDVSFTYTAWAGIDIRPLTDIDRIFYMKFVGNPERGPVMEPEWWKVVLQCKEALPLIGDKVGAIKFTGKVLSDRENHPDDPFGHFPIKEDWPS